MKKLLTIVASALTLGAYAGQENVPVAFDTSSVPVGTEVNVEANGEVVATTQTIGRKLFALLPSGYTAYGLKLANADYTVIDTDFTAATACPVGWTAESYRASEGRTVTFNTNGATATNWDQGSIRTDCSITPDVETTIDVVTGATGDNNNLVICLASSDYSVLIGNSYNDAATKKIRIGAYEGDATTKFASFQTDGDKRANPADSTVVAETAEIDVGKPLTYHLVITGTTITGTVTGTKTGSNPAESAEKAISFTLPEEYNFTTFAIDIDGKNTVSVKSVTIKNDQVPPREATTVYAKNNTLEGGFTLDGEDTDLVNGDVIAIKLGTMSGSQWQMNLSKHAGHNYVFEKNEGSDNRFSVVSDIPANTAVTIGKGTLVYFYNGNNDVKDHAVATGVVVNGEGTLEVENIVTVNGNVEIAVTTLNVTSGSFKLADGATLKVPVQLADGKVSTDVAKRRVKFDESTKTYSLIEQIAFKIPYIENAKAQYKYDGGEWIDAPEASEGYYSILIDKSTKFFFQYVALEGYTITGNQGGYFYSSGLGQDTTYDNPKTDLTVAANITQDDVDASVDDISAAIVDLINGAESATVTIPAGVTITITGAATLEGLAESTAKTTVVGDGTAKTVTRPTVESTTGGFYKVEATTAN